MKNNTIFLLIMTTIFCIFSCTKKSENSITPSKSTLNSIKKISVENTNVIVKLDSTKNEVIFEVPIDFDISKLTPKIEVSPKATIFPNPLDFTKQLIIEIIAENGSTKKYTVQIIRKDEDLTIYFTINNSVVALNTDDGSLLWQAQPTIKAAQGFVLSNKILYGRFGNSLVSLDSKNGSILKTFDITACDHVPVIDSLNIYYACGKLYSLNKISGILNWKIDDFSNTLFGIPAYDNKNVYVSYSGINAFEKTVGKKVWSSPKGYFNTKITQSNGNLLITLDNQLYSLNIASNKENWMFLNDNVSDFNFSKPIIINGKIYVMRKDNNSNSILFVHNEENGKLLWQFNIPNSTRAPINAPNINNGVIYVGGNNTLYALDANNGKEIWNFNTNGIFNESPIVSDSYVYLGVNDGKFYCLNVKNGQQKWVKTFAVSREFSHGCLLRKSGKSVNPAFTSVRDY